MRLQDFFRCCLPAPREDFDDDQRDSSRSTTEDNSNKKKSGKGIWKRLAKPSKKKLRKEAKQLRNQMADRKRREVHVMDIISEYEEPTKAPRPRPVKWETLYENEEDIKIDNMVIHKSWVHATQHSRDATGPAVIHVGMSEGEAAQVKADIPLSISLLESVYANLSSGIDIDLLRHLEQLSKDLCKRDNGGGDEPSQASESLVLVPNAGDLELVQRPLTMHEEEEKKKKGLLLEEEKKEGVLFEEKKKKGLLLEEERRLRMLACFQRGGLAVFNTATAAAVQMKYILALLFSNIFVIMMHKLYLFINI
ncbi:uncharacterized protein LOC134437627 [Engraulis encrasicolus]|uniref:uncharacterized protein LOC134437627 n=1 Tax=Engraulis encrasicolus TaxID=184585 RepID=UPI002FD24107